jgi:integration host factor subunit beta
MLKSELEYIIEEEFKLDKVLGKKVINTLIESMIGALKDDDRIEIRGFGSFFPKTYDSYRGRNPKTGEAIAVPEKILPIFRPSKDLIAKLNKKKD